MRELDTTPRRGTGRGVRAVVAARTWIGTPVVWEASLKGKGCDCRGLVAGVARDNGWPEGAALEASVKAYSRNISEAQLMAGLDRLFDRVDSLAGAASLIEGDVLGFTVDRKMQHLGIYAGDGRMIHAYMTSPSLVIEVPMGTYWINRLAGAWRWRDIAEPGNG